MRRTYIHSVLIFPVLLLITVLAATAQIVISGNENKIDLTSGAPKVIAPNGPDSLSILDFSKFPPLVEHISDVANSVVGPPSNIAITKDRKLALIANSLKAMNGSNLHSSSPYHSKHGAVVLLARKGKTFRVVQELPIGRIPEGVAFTSDGKYLVLQCHPDRELWIFSVKGARLKDTGQRIKVPGMPSSLRASP